ncbi:MAG: carbonic anhydrase family protein [Blastocatellia bacterium]|nr:carbonic anhydrase family protein [Blastocatellia bacterium]
MKKIISLISLFIAFTVLTNGCSHEEPKPVNETPHKKEAHWSYKGVEGPESWGNLKPEYEACSIGKSQSPIDITDASPQDLPAITFDYRPSALSVLNNGHTIEVRYDAGSSIEVEGGTYALKQFHFHGPSEHTLKSAHSPMEVHLVHENDAMQLAVVGILIDSGSENQALLPVWNNLPKEPGQERKPEGVKVDAKSLLPTEHLYYRYDGSLTTPPCSEGVKWFVLTKAIEMSNKQVASFKVLFDHNNRPVQPLNGRIIRVDSSPN